MRPSQAHRRLYVLRDSGIPRRTYRSQPALALAWGVIVAGALMVVALGAGLGWVL